MKQFLIILLLISVSLFSQNSKLTEGLGLDSTISQQETNFSCKSAAESANPAEFSGGEGVPPLPLPAVPLRRTEKKNPPVPPVLIVKIITDKQSDWNTNPNDTNNLLKWMSKELNVNFSTENKTFDEVFNQLKHVYLPVKLVESSKNN